MALIYILQTLYIWCECKERHLCMDFVNRENDATDLHASQDGLKIVASRGNGLIVDSIGI